MASETCKIVIKSSPEFIQNIITIKENSYNFRYQKHSWCTETKNNKVWKNKVLVMR